MSSRIKATSLRAWLESRYSAEQAEQIFNDIQARAANRKIDMRTAEVVQDSDGEFHIIVPNEPAIDAPQFVKSKNEWEQTIRAARKHRLPADATLSALVKMKFKPFVFFDLLPPQGVLSNLVACHALWYYYTVARHAFEFQDAANNPDVRVYEGEKDPSVNYKQLLNTVAEVYSTRPEYMIRHWSAVDLQARLLDLPLLPDSDKFRHNAPIELGQSTNQPRRDEP